MAAFRRMFSRPVNSGWKPMPSSSSEATLPRTVTAPAVGEVTPESSLSRVLLPAPFSPTIPRLSPWRSSKLTSRSASKAW